ncbi:MAG TPA: hypothetical protein PKI03_10165 [Pseudomonadota bacterium]|nr:hypothetical protein [Pseudomonadota bacterium]
MKTRADCARSSVRAARLLTPLLLSWALLGSAVAAPVSCDEDAACRPVVSRAREFSKAGQLEDALLSYQAAYRIAADPRILFNIARMQHKLNKFAEAADSYQKFLETKFDDENLRSKAQEYLTQVQAAQAQAQAEPAPGPALGAAGSTGDASKLSDSGSSKPVYKKAWFWVVIGTVVAAGVAGGVAGGVIASQQPPAAPDSVPTFHLFM